MAPRRTKFFDPKDLAERALKGQLSSREAADLIARLLDLYPPANPRRSDEAS